MLGDLSQMEQVHLVAMITILNRQAALQRNNRLQDVHRRSTDCIGSVTAALEHHLFELESEISKI